MEISTNEEKYPLTYKLLEVKCSQLKIISKNSYLVNFERILQVDSTLLKVIPTKNDRTAAADELNVDLRKVYLWGRKWNFYFEPDKCHSLRVSLTKDLDKHPPVFVDFLFLCRSGCIKDFGD